MKLDSYVAFSKSSGKFVGIDEASGGYPWFPDGISQAKIVSRKDSEQYSRFKELVIDINTGRFFNSPGKDFVIHQIEIYA